MKAILPKRLKFEITNDLDSLSFFSIVLNLYYVVHWSKNYADILNPTITFLPIPQILLSLSLIGFLIPRSNKLLLINSILFTAYYIYNSPISSNNQTTAFFLSLLTLLTLILAMLKQNTNSFSRGDIIKIIRGPGKLILACMYFYGIYHKLNTDFFNPDVSCAVELYKPIAEIVGQESNRIGQWMSIYLTFIIESIAMMGLLFRRFCKLGLVVGIPFHIIIGFTGFTFFIDFSTIVLAMYALLTNDESLRNIKTVILEKVKSKYFRISIILLPSIIALLILLHIILCGGICSTKKFMPIFAIYSISIYVILLLTQMTDEKVFVKSKIFYLIPLIFFLNGLSPYVGLKTESSIAMFSNLHVEGGTTNHFFHGVIPGFANYSDEVITVINSNNSEMSEGLSFVRYDFDRRLTQLKNPELTVLSNTSSDALHISASSEDWENTYASTNWLVQKFLIFKTVDYNRPKVCTH